MPTATLPREEPWAKRKTDFKRMETILYVTAEVVRQVAVLSAAVMPQAADKLLDLLGQAADRRSFTALGADGRLQAGTTIPAPAGVFPRTSRRRLKAESARKDGMHNAGGPSLSS